MQIFPKRVVEILKKMGCSQSSYIQVPPPPGIYHFCIMIKDFPISFSRVITVQDFETVTFYVLFVYKPTFSVIFC